MALPEDLLEQARHLATWELRKPRQASLRRSISTAYYALFHQLVAEAARRFSREQPNLLPKIARTLAHAEMYKVCKSIAAGGLSETLRELQPGGFSSELQQVAKAFVRLQKQRHQADYDLGATYTRIETLELVGQAEFAFREWRKVQRTAEANIFLAALLFASRWSK